MNRYFLLALFLLGGCVRSPQPVCFSESIIVHVFLSCNKNNKRNNSCEVIVDDGAIVRVEKANAKVGMKICDMWGLREQ